MYCVLCIVYSVLCIVYSVLCILYCVLGVLCIECVAHILYVPIVLFAFHTIEK